MTNPRRANGYRRDQVRARVLAEEQDCWLCHEPVDKTLGLMPGQHSRRCIEQQRDCTGCVPDPMRAEVDEIVPVSLGGSAVERSNCRLSHRICNVRRGNGTKKPKLVASVVVASNIW